MTSRFRAVAAASATAVLGMCALAGVSVVGAGAATAGSATRVAILNATDPARSAAVSVAGKPAVTVAPRQLYAYEGFPSTPFSVTATLPATGSTPAATISTTVPSSAGGDLVLVLQPSKAAPGTTLTTFANDLSPTPAGQARLVVRAVGISGGFDVVVDGAITLSDLSTQPGGSGRQQATALLPATPATVQISSPLATGFDDPPDVALPFTAGHTYVLYVGTDSATKRLTVLQTDYAGQPLATTSPAPSPTQPASPTGPPVTGSSPPPASPTTSVAATGSGRSGQRLPTAVAAGDGGRAPAPPGTAGLSLLALLGGALVVVGAQLGRRGRHRSTRRTGG